nr:hypothetical protein [uncultured Draconibacterium sp.]
MEMFRDQYVTLNRPYLSLNNVVSTRRNNGMEIRASLHNNGNTPALIVENNFIDLYGNGVKSVSKKNFFINPHEAVGDLFAFVPNESIMDTTPFYTNYLYHSNLVDTTYYIEYWGKIHNGNVMIDSMKY